METTTEQKERLSKYPEWRQDMILNSNTWMHKLQSEDGNPRQFIEKEIKFFEDNNLPYKETYPDDKTIIIEVDMTDASFDIREKAYGTGLRQLV
ncbi:MAG TPA: hypothetical protein VEA37_11885 [Flavobacterium sp.]|nr:hypothetical protein [Flavobacterium sp.]